MNFSGVIACIYDKLNAKLGNGKRLAENFLFFLAIAGGSMAMFLCMLIIRHKTRRVKFMIGFPFIIIIQICLLYLALTH